MRNRNLHRNGVVELTIRLFWRNAPPGPIKRLPLVYEGGGGGFYKPSLTLSVSTLVPPLRCRQTQQRTFSGDP